MKSDLPEPSIPPDDSKNTPRVGLLREFAGYTTAHGLSRFSDASRIYSRILWAAILCGTYAGFAVHLSTLVQRYLERPSSTSVNTRLDLKIPDFYFCKNNQFSISKVLSQIENAKEITSSSSAYKQKLEAAINDGLDRGLDNMDALGFLSIYDMWTRRLIDALFKNTYNGKCRNYIEGYDFSGTVNQAVRVDMNHSKALESSKMSCLSWNDVRMRMAVGWPGLNSSSQQTLLNLLNGTKLNGSKCGMLEDSYGGIYTLKMVSEILYLGSSLPTTPKGFSASNYWDININQGPYCFTEGSGGGLKVDSCQIPFCSTNSSNPDCRDDLNPYYAYTGKVSTSVSGKTCINWQEFLNGSFFDRINRTTEVRDDLFLSEFAFLSSSKYKGFLPDEPNAENYCRQATVLIGKDNDYSGEYSWSDFVTDPTTSASSSYNKKIPWCLVENNKYGGPIVYAEQCKIPSCADTIKSIGRSVLDTTTKPILDKSFGADLEVSLLSCSYGGLKCSISDFTTFSHPQLGACFRFNKSAVRQRLPNYGDKWDNVLEVKLFTDSYGVSGKPYPDQQKMLSMMSGSSTEPEQSGFYIFVQPKDIFPFISEGILATAGAHTTVKYSYQNEVRLATSKRPCASDSVDVSYFLPYWNKGLDTNLNPYKQYAGYVNISHPYLMVLPYFRNFDRKSMQYKTGQRDCINQLKVKSYIDQCHCRPYHLPVTADLEAVPLCYGNNNNSDDIVAKHACFQATSEKLAESENELRDKCPISCITETHPYQTVIQTWPDMFQEGLQRNLRSLTSSLGFPTKVSRWKGISGLYLTQLVAADMMNQSLTSNLEYMRAMADTSRSSLLWITLKAEGPTGMEIVEEEAYPLKNLFADFGGILGLWCGISVLTVCELAELGMLICLSIFNRRQKNIQPTVA